MAIYLDHNIRYMSEKTINPKDVLDASTLHDETMRPRVHAVLCDMYKTNPDYFESDPADITPEPKPEPTTDTTPTETAPNMGYMAEVMDQEFKERGRSKNQDVRTMEEIQDGIHAICKEMKLGDGPTEAFIINAPTPQQWREDQGLIKDVIKKANRRKNKKLTGDDRIQQVKAIHNTGYAIRKLYEEKVQRNPAPTLKEVEREVKEEIEAAASEAANHAYNTTLKNGGSEDEAKKAASRAAVKATKDGEAAAIKDGRLNASSRMWNEIKKVQKLEDEARDKADLEENHPETAKLVNYIEEREWPAIGDHVLSKEYCVLSAEYDLLKYDNGVYRKLFERETPAKYIEDIQYLVYTTLNSIEDLPGKQYLFNMIKSKHDRINIADSMIPKLQERRREELINPPRTQIAYKDKLVTVTADGLEITEHDPQLYHRIQIPHDLPQSTYDFKFNTLWFAEMWFNRIDGVMPSYTQCPKFDAWLKQLCVNAAGKRDRRKEYLVWQLIAMCVTGDMWRIPHYWTILGNPGSGKGTLIRLLIMILGKHNVNSYGIADFNSENNGTNSYETMINKLLNYDSDGSHTKEITLTDFYKMTSYEEVTLNTKFKPTFNTIIDGVKLVAFTKIKFEMDNNHWRRILPLRLYNEFDGPARTGEPDYEERFNDEIPAIIQKALKTAINMTRYNRDMKGKKVKLIGGYTILEKQNIVLQPTEDDIVKVLRDTRFTRSKTAIPRPTLSEIVGAMMLELGYDQATITTKTDQTAIGHAFSDFKNPNNKKNPEYYVDVIQIDQIPEPDPSIVPE